jgi:hypothetical protein
MTGPLRTRAVNALRHADHALSRLFTSARVLVDVRTPMNLAILRPVWMRLRADARVDVRFTSEPGTGVAEAAAVDGVDGALVTRAAAAWTRFDLAMTADLWNRTALHRCRRRINFFHGVAGKYDLDDPVRLAAADLHQFDRMAFINADRMERYLAAGAVARSQAVLVGYPKGDELVNGRWQAPAVRASLGLSPSVQTVLYAPTFSPANSLHLAGPAIISALLASGRNVIVKLHDRSMVPHAKFTEGVDWPARLTAFGRHPRFALARAADAGPFLAAADVLVTDHSTVGFEFALLDRPLVVYDAPLLREAARIDADKWALLRSMADVVTSPEELTRAVDLAFTAPTRLRSQRQQARALFAHAGSATDRAIRVVYELLELTPAFAESATSYGLPRFSTPAPPPPGDAS